MSPKGHCYICGGAMTAVHGCSNTASREHLVPRSKGGKGADNIRPACVICNNLKGDTPLSEFIGAVVNRTKRIRKTAIRLLRAFDAYSEGAEERWLATIAAHLVRTQAVAVHQSETLGRALAAAISEKQRRKAERGEQA